MLKLIQEIFDLMIKLNKNKLRIYQNENYKYYSIKFILCYNP